MNTTHTFRAAAAALEAATKAHKDAVNDRSHAIAYGTPQDVAAATAAVWQAAGAQLDAATARAAARANMTVAERINADADDARDARNDHRSMTAG